MADIGSKGLAEVNLIIPQSTSLSFTVVHKNEAGNVVDHSGSTCHMDFQSLDKETNYDMSQYCTCSAAGIDVSIPMEETEKLPLGKLNWDMIVETTGDVVRLCYGKVSVVDTYALDEES